MDMDQNPPCLPALLACLVFSHVVNDCVICIDWHNLGFSMFDHQHQGQGQGQRSSSAVARLSRFLECTLARRVHFHITVSQAMKVQHTRTRTRS